MSLKIKILYIDRKYAQEFSIQTTGTKIEDWVSEMKVIF